MLTNNLLVPKSPFFTIAFFGWLAFVTYASLASFSDIDTSTFKIPFADKIVHFIFYFTAAVLGVFFVREQVKWTVTLGKTLLLIFLFTLVFGILIEVIQYNFTENREGDLFDALANGFGSLMGVLTSRFLFSKKGYFNWAVEAS